MENARPYWFVIACLFVASLQASVEIHPHYPKTRQESFVEELHGTPVKDPYRWLENGENPEVQRWTEEQNAITLAYLNSVEQRHFIEARLSDLGYYHQVSFVDVLQSDRRFVWVHPVDRERPTLFWQEREGAPLRPLLDPNRWENGAQLEFATPSHDGAYLAYGVSSGGSEQVVLHILHVDTGVELPDTFCGRNHGWPAKEVVWIPGTQSFFYGAWPDSTEVAPGEENYWQAIYLHHLGNQSYADVKIVQSSSCRENLHLVEVDESGKWAVLITHGRGEGYGTEVHLLSLSAMDDPPIPLVTGFKANVEAHWAGDHLLLLSDANAPNKCVFSIDPLNPHRDNWQLLIPEGPDPLLRVQGIAGRIFAEYLHNAASVIRVSSGRGDPLHTVPLRSLGTATVSGFWSKPAVWVEFSSFACPQTVFGYDVEQNYLFEVDKGTRQVNPHRYTVKQVWYKSYDGTPISMFLFFDHTCSNARKRPTLLTGYGGFGIPITPTFVDHYLSFVEAGGLVAIPNLRGGGEYGENWHSAGRLANKQNVFDDFISAAEWLIEKGYCTPDSLAIRGRSNGGLLIGAAMTQRPDLFCAALCEVPLLDMVRYHKFGFSNIWSSEYGNADNSDQFDYLMNYSPYHTVEDGASYPAVLIRGAANDSRTDAFHVRKMIARLQHADPIGLPKFGLILEGAGHLGAPDISSQIQEKVYGLSFLMDQLGMKVPHKEFRIPHVQFAPGKRMSYGFSARRN